MSMKFLAGMTKVFYDQITVMMHNSEILSHFSCVCLFGTPGTVAPLQAPLSMGILQARILEWVAMPFSRRSSQAGDRTRVSSISCFGRQVLYH